jgi:uncharacterized protein (DUF4415 family)
MKKRQRTKRRRPDDAPLTDAELKTGRRLQGEELAFFRRAAQRGRPAGRTKETTSVSFDREVLARMRMHKGWQTWLNALAKAALSVEQPKN